MKRWIQHFTFYIASVLAIYWPGIALASPPLDKHELSGSIGLGIATTKDSGKWIGTSKTAGNFRLLFDLQMEQRYLWGLDLDWFRINRRTDSAIPFRLDGEGIGLVAAYRLNGLSLWARWGGGRLFVRRGEPNRMDASRHAYYKSSAGVSWALFQASHVWVELVGSLSHLQVARSLSRDLGPREMALIDLQLAIKLFDL